MTAAVFAGDGRLDIAQRPMPRIESPDDVVIKVENCGVCGSDLAVLGVPPRHDAAVGTILGHEFSGHVEEVGSGVRELRRGDRVVVAPNVSCRTCVSCQGGQFHHCRNLTIHGIWIDGGLAPYVAVGQSSCHRIADDVPQEVAALVEPLSTVVRGVQQARPFPGDTIVVIGGGPIGLMFTALFSAAGTTVVLVEPSERRAALAAAMGATALLAPDSPDVVSTVADLTGGEGADIVVDAVGSQLASCIQLVKRSGRVVTFGVDTTAVTPVQQFDITHRELEIVGAMVGTATFPTAIRLVERGAVTLSPMVTHRVGLADLDEALADVQAGAAVKVQVEFE